MTRGIFGDDARFRATYWERFPGMYFAGDGARIDEDGDFWLLGRVDDVMNVSGHRISTIEVESALVDHPSVAEAAVCGRADALTGQAIVAFVTLKGGAGGLGRDARGAPQPRRREDRPDREAGEHRLHARAPEDALREDHAAAATRRGRGQAARRHDDARRSRGRRRDPRPRGRSARRGARCRERPRRPRRCDRCRPRSSASSRPRAGSRARRPTSSRSSMPRRSPAREASTRSVVSSSSKRKSTWLSTTSFSTSQPGRVAIASANCCARAQRALDEVGDARAPERAQRRVDGEAARTARELGRPVHLVARGVRIRDEVLGGEPHRRAMRIRVRDEREAAVVRDVEPLVRVRRPRVRLLDAAARCRSCGDAPTHSPNAPSTCSQARPSRVSAAISEIESNAPVFTSPAWAQTITGPSMSRSAVSSASIRIRPFESASMLIVDPLPRPRRRSARSIVTCRLPPATTVIFGEPARPFSSTSQPTPLEHGVACGCEARHVRHLAPRDERERRCRRDAEQVLEPLPGDLFHHGRRRAAHDQARVLIPGRGEPVSRQGGGQRAADDEAEVPSARDPDDAGIRRPRTAPR